MQRFFDVTAFLAGLGILGFTIGFAMQDIMQNFVAGVILLIQQPFDVGDFIEEAEVLVAIVVSDGLVRRARRLQWVQSLISGVEVILALPSLRKDILLTSSRGIHGPQMSEMAFLHMLNLSRNYPRMYRNQLKGIWERWPQQLLYKKSVGILGVGVVGKRSPINARPLE